MTNSNNIGALWLKNSKSGMKYFNGVIEWKGEKFYISIFKNNKKTKDNQPDYNILWNSEEYKGNSQNNNKNVFDNEDVPF